MLSLSEDPRYGFAVGRVRALETTLIDRPRYDRLVRTRGSEEFVAALAETVYGKFLEGGTVGVSRAFGSAANDNVEFFRTYALDEWLVRMFTLPAAFLCLKEIVKQALSEGKSGIDLPQPLDAAPEKPLLKQVVADTVEAFRHSREPAAIDVAMDRLLHELQLRLASDSAFIAGYLGLHADIENLRTFVRLRGKGEADQRAAEEVEAAFLSGGALTLASLQAALTLPWPAVEDLLGKDPPFGMGSAAFGDYLETGHAAVVERRSFTRMERLGREQELRYLRQTRYATFGHEPLATYFLLRESELRNLRLLYAAKLAGLGDEETQDLVAYVE